MKPAVVLLLLVVLERTSGHMRKNIARQGTVAQSSLYQKAVPGKATDGNRASEWRQNSCTHTNKELRPWWRVDLQKSYRVKTISITNRKDCCHERLNGAEIRIGDSLDDNGNTNPKCATIKGIRPGKTRTFQCKGMVGQYVNIVIPGREEYLTLCEVEVSGQPLPAINIARQGIVAQSSLYQNAVPGKATDGNRASEWRQNSCTHTNKELRPWWRVDLQKSYRVKTISITNRKDCCHERLNGAEIRIGDSLDDNGNTNPKCATIEGIGPGKTRTFQCKGMVGQYVNIVIPGREEYLTLCEVEVSGKPLPAINIARQGIVAQSSLYQNAVPGKATDGNRASEWRQNSCTHTNKDLRPWWRVDLQKSYRVKTISITNRKDCCHKRLNGAEIRIGDSLDDNGNTNPKCATIKVIGPGQTRTFQCKGMVGQYVNIVIPGREEYLTLCEVEVTGQPLPAINIARQGIVAQSSLYQNAVPGKAIDGNRASLWKQNSCTHTNKDLRPWWRVDLQKSYRVKTISITNRKDCCHKRLNGAEIRIGDSLDDNGNTNPKCATIKGIGPGQTRTFQCKGMVGQYVNIVIPGREEYLTLCEVEVTGQPLPAINIARQGIVAQSSLYQNAVPGKAIDGNRASLWKQNSCTHTNKDLRPWWRVDFQRSYRVMTISITNRKDCCHKRLNGAEIRIGDSLDDNGNTNPKCATIKGIRPGQTRTFQCKGMVGQYVNIVIPGREEYLTLCEVEVTGQPLPAINIARQGTAVQSSLYQNAVPGKAIDGNHASEWKQNSCTHTNKDLNPWWRLDLQRSYRVMTISITNRKDCCHKRLNGAEIRIGHSLDDNGNANPKCTVISTIPAGARKTFQCNGMKGRYVNIVIPNRQEYLTLCEVEVTGIKSDDEDEDDYECI